MRRSASWLLLAVLLPCGSAWGYNNYYAQLVAKVSGNSTGCGKVYAGTSTTPGEYAAPSSTSDQQTSTGKSGGVDKTFYAFAQANEGYDFSHWSDAENGSSVSTDNPYAVTVATSTTASGCNVKTVWANFTEATVDPFSVTFLAPENGTYTVDGESSYGGKGPYTKVYSPQLAATAGDGYAFNGWYATTDGGTTKTYLSRAASHQPKFMTAVTVGADFVPSVSVTTYAALVQSLAANACTEIPAGTTLLVESGETLTIGAGKTLLVNGTLDVVGKVVNGGAIRGGGTLVAVTEIVTQEGRSGDDPFVTDCADAAKNVSYYKTTVETRIREDAVGGTAAECTVWLGAAVLRNGTRLAVCGWPQDVTPAGLYCTIDGSKAVNGITGLFAPYYFTDTATGFATVKGDTTTKMLLMLSSPEVDNAAFANAGLLTAMGKYQKLQANLGVLDLAGNTVTISPSYIDNYEHIVLNGRHSVETLVYFAGITEINCTVDIQEVMNGSSYPSKFHIYDCAAGSFVKSYDGSSTPVSEINVYASGESTYSTNDFVSPAAAYHIYGGAWAEKPDASFIAASLASTHEFHQHDDTHWYLEPKTDTAVVELDDGQTFASLDAAFAAIESAYAAGSEAFVMTMKRDASVTAPITVPAGKSLEIELAGCPITAPNGLVVNHGTFAIGDRNANLVATGGRVLTESGNWIVNDGTAEVTYGHYTGDMQLHGGAFTTHHGYFTGAVTEEDGGADLRGGFFVRDVKAVLRDGYLQTVAHDVIDPSAFVNCIGPFPKPVVAKTFADGYWKYNVKVLADADLALYNSSSNQKSDYSPADWKRRAEVRSMVEPYLTAYHMDCTVAFDRAVAADSATAHITKPNIGDRAIDRDVAAAPDGLYRILMPYFADGGYSQKQYNHFLSSSTYQNLEFGISSDDAANRGTTANVRIDFCEGADGTNLTKVVSKFSLVSEYAVFGSGSAKAAMIRRASGVAFYDTLAEAIADCAEDETVVLANDIADTATVVVAKTCRIDMNGMAFAGTLKAADGCSVTVTEKSAPLEYGIPRDHRTYAFVRSAAPAMYWLQ